MRLWLLGTGTPTPTLRRMCSGYLVHVGSDTRPPRLPLEGVERQVVETVFRKAMEHRPKLPEVGLPPA